MAIIQIIVQKSQAAIPDGGSGWSRPWPRPSFSTTAARSGRIRTTPALSEPESTIKLLDGLSVKLDNN